MQPEQVLMIGGAAIVAAAALQFGGPPLWRWIKDGGPRLPSGPVPMPATPSEPAKAEIFASETKTPMLVRQWWDHMRRAGGDVEFTAAAIADGCSLTDAMERRIGQLESAKPAPAKKPKA